MKCSVHVSKDNQSNKLVKIQFSIAEFERCLSLVGRHETFRHHRFSRSDKKCLRVQSPRQGLKFIRLDT